MNRKLVIENQVMENGIKNETQVKVKRKYWHKSQHWIENEVKDMKLKMKLK